MPSPLECTAVPSPLRSVPAFVPWLVWGLGAALFGWGWFQRVAPGVMVDTLMREFSVGGAVLGNLSAVYFYTYAISQVPAGLIVDAYGSRRIMVLSALLCVVGGLVFAQADGIVSAYVGRILIGLAAGPTFVVALNLAAVWCPRDRLALLSGLLMSVGVLGALVGQVPLAWGVEIFGWRASMYTATLVVLVLCVATWVVLRLPRPKPRAAAPAGLKASFASVLKRWDTWYLTLGGTSTMAIMLTFSGLWAVPWLTQVHGFTRADAALLISVNAIGWGIGAPVLGWLSDRLNRRKLPFLGGVLLSVTSFAALIHLPDLSPAAIYTLLFLQGLGTGGIMLIFVATHDRFAGGQEGVSVGIVNSGIMIGAATMQPLVGWVLDRNWQGVMVEGARVYDGAAYQQGFDLLIACGLVAVVVGVLMPETAKARDGAG
ncbi:MAG: MFS transporter [Rhodospirillaceae bacterium]|nr:MFS transporter [Magnetovibrio sp.]MAY66958.1 MFS transporter [Rhodospirillaceae bacterium]